MDRSKYLTEYKEDGCKFKVLVPSGTTKEKMELYTFLDFGKTNEKDCNAHGVKLCQDD